MLSSFEWICLCRTGSELIATLECLTQTSETQTYDMALGGPFSALNGPCRRCWTYAPASKKRKRSAALYCPMCRHILRRSMELGQVSRSAIVVWGYVNQLPRYLVSGEGFYQEYSKGHYVHDQQRFLLLLHHKEIRTWLQELAMYHGHGLLGLLQFFPTIGFNKGIDMGELICRAAHHEARFAMDQLRVRFYSAPLQLLRPHIRDDRGMLTFEVSEFLSLLEMAMVFKTLMFPEEQKALYELLKLDDPAERHFYWGRFLSHLHQEAKDMLSAWNIRQWPENRVQLLYELLNYVVFEQTY